MKLRTRYYPSIEELYALEHEARRLRAHAVNAALRDAFAAIKSLFTGTGTGAAPRTVKHA